MVLWEPQTHTLRAPDGPGLGAPEGWRLGECRQLTYGENEACKLPLVFLEGWCFSDELASCKACGAGVRHLTTLGTPESVLG